MLNEVNKDIDEVLLAISAAKNSEDAEYEIGHAGRILASIYHLGYCEPSARKMIKERKEEGVVSEIHQKLPKLETAVMGIAQVYKEDTNVQTIYRVFLNHSRMLGDFLRVQDVQVIHDYHRPLLREMEESLKNFQSNRQAACDTKYVDASTKGIEKKLISLQTMLKAVDEELKVIKEKCFSNWREHGMNFTFEEAHIEYLDKMKQCSSDVDNVQKELSNRLAVNKVCDAAENFFSLWNVETINGLIRTENTTCLTEVLGKFEALKKELRSMLGPHVDKRVPAALQKITEILCTINFETSDKLAADIERCGAWVIENKKAILSKKLMTEFLDKEREFNKLRTRIESLSTSQDFLSLIRRVEWTFRDVPYGSYGKHTNALEQARRDPYQLQSIQVMQEELQRAEAKAARVMLTSAPSTEIPAEPVTLLRSVTTFLQRGDDSARGSEPAGRRPGATQ